MKKVLLVAAVAFALASCGNSNSNKEAAAETKATEHVCNHNHGEGHECNHNHEGEHKCNHAADSTKHECNHNHEGEHKCNHAAADTTKHECNHETGECNQPAEKQCDKCKEAAANKAAEQAK